MKRLVSAIALSLLFALSLLLGVVLHVDTPRGKRLVLERVNAMLESSFAGSVRIDELESVRGGRVKGARGSVFDRDGREVIALEGVNLSLDTSGLVRSLFSGPALKVRIDELTVAHAEIRLVPTASGQLSLVTAFEPRTPSTTPSRPTDVAIEDIRIAHAWVHGRVPDGPPIDADLMRVAGALTFDDAGLALELAHARIVARRLPRGLDANVELSGNMSIAADVPGSLSARARLTGEIGDLPLQLAGSIEGDQLEAELYVARARPAVMAAIVPELPLAVPLSLEARVAGKLPRLRAEVDLGIGRGRLVAAANARLGAQPSVDFELEGRRVSPRAFVADAPPAELSFDARGALVLRDEGKPYGEIALRLQPSKVAGTAVPALSIDAHGSDRRIEASLRAHEPGAPISAEVSFVPQPGGGRVTLDAESLVPELARVSRLQERVRGRLLVRARGTLELPRGELRGHVSASGLGLAAGPVHARAITSRGDVTGTLSDPRISLRLDASQVRALGRTLSRLALSASGPVERPTLAVSWRGPGVPALSARAELAFGPETRAEDLTAELERAGVVARLDIAALRAGAGRMAIEDLTLSGVGQLEASLQMRGTTLSGEARADGLELDKISKLLNISVVSGGRASFDARLRSERRGVFGKLRASLVGVRALGFDAASASAELELEGRRVSGSLAAKLDDALTLSAVTRRLRLPEGELTKSSLRQLRGELDVVADADLRRLSALVPSEMLPVSSVAGQLRLAGNFVRSDDDRQIEARFEARTRGLALQGRGSSSEIETRQQALRRAPWKLSGVDVHLDALFHDDQHPSHFRVRLYDRRGTLARANVAAALPLAELVRAPGQALARVRAEPLSADVWVPERRLDTLPVPIRPRRVAGKLALAAHLRGTLADPKLELDLRADELVRRGERNAAPFGVRAGLKYAAQRGSFDATISESKRDVLALSSHFSADLGQLVQGRDPGFKGSITARARKFRLQSVSLIADRQIKGTLVGDLELRGLGYQPEVAGQLAIHRLEIARSSIERAQLALDVRDGRLSSRLAVRQSDGYLDAELTAGLVWQRQLLPRLDQNAPLHAVASARGFDAGVLLPLVDDSVSKLSGRIDASVVVDVSGGASRLAGGLSVRQGRVQIPAIGQELRDIRARVDFEPNGLLVLRDASARGTVGRVRASAAARFSGFRFVGAKARAQIAESEKMPLTIEGVSVGNAWGKVELEARNLGPRKTRLDVDVGSFHLEMPRLGQRDLQSLDDAEHVRIGVRRGKRFVTLPLQPLEERPEGEPSELVVRVRLGDDVWLRQGTMLRAKLDGAVNVKIVSEPRIFGEIRISRGRIDVQGKIFELVHGSVVFDGSDPPNPTVVARARWESPDGIVVFADFSGRADSGELNLHSQPSLTDDQILALLLFGDPDGTLGVGQSGDGRTATAVGLGGGVATQGLNAALDRLTDIDVTARIDTSGANPRPEIAVQLSPRLSAAIGYNVGEPTPGTAPDRTLLLLDFRLSRRWSLASTFGDRGSSLLDLIWRYRY